MTREEQIAVIRARWPEMSKQEIERFLSPTLLPRLGRGRPKERAKQLATATLFERDGRNQKGMYDSARHKTAATTGQGKSTVEDHDAKVKADGEDWLFHQLDREGRLPEFLARLARPVAK